MHLDAAKKPRPVHCALGSVAAVAVLARLPGAVNDTDALAGVRVAAGATAVAGGVVVTADLDVARLPEAAPTAEVGGTT